MWRSRNVWGRGIALVVAVLMLLSGEAFGSIATNGVVTGGIIPCAAIPNPNDPHYAAGTVTVLKGRVAWKSTAQGDYLQDVLPTSVVAQESIATNATYRFALEPGQYVLQARFPPRADYGPYIEITVQPGDDLWVDIPNRCI